MSSSSSTGPRPQAHDVLVKFSVKHPRPEVLYPERRVILEQSKTSVLVIGRSSKRFNNLEAKGDNCYFDSPVMSREHAKITIDWYHKKLNIKDIGSLHGTYHNSQRLQPRTLCELQQHDTLKFGIDIQRSNELFPPCTVEVEWEWDTLMKAAQASNQIKSRPSFAVPDDSDSSDCDDGITESDVRDTAVKLRKIGMLPAPAVIPGRLFVSSIDLTMDSPMHEPETNGDAIDPIVIDEDSQTPSQDLVESSLITTQRELGAPREEEEILVPSLDDHRQPPPAASSDSESAESDDESYDDESSSYPDELPSSYDGLLGSCDEDINLSASDSEENSEDDDNEEDEEQEVEIESGSDVESDIEPLDNPSYEPDHPMAHDYDSESVAEQPDSTLWADEGTSYMCSQSMPKASLSHQPCDVPATWQSEQPSVQGAPSRPLGPMQMPALPPIVWPALTIADQGEQGRPNDFRLPSILNPLDPHVESFSEGSNCAQQFPAVQSTEHPAQKEVVSPSYTHWQRAYETPKLIAAPADKGSWTLAQNKEPSAEALGHLTGKSEFFAAREHNKALMRRQEQQEDSSQPKARTSQTTEVSAEVLTSQTQPIGVSNRAAASEPEAPKSTNVAESVWSASGDMFLNTPQDFPLSEVRNTSPELDMTSAYQFHQSKLASSQISTVDAAQPATSEPDRAQQTAVALRSPKRKAEEISTLAPEEEAIETSKQTASEMQITSGQTVPAAVKPVNECATPPSKRLRGFLTKAGYFLGGGVVTAAGLVTVLSAAAPAL
ncbi:FHA domain-containing protein [Colletotrichum navitas]|uniref:FHA domain-containing protein n=1 Tax=Colletotrichum navitas TaxID=681940 RepID=A0AAD8PLA6_9PEZI|nr:FHA domain-containing protein [Colletotrichum navitas]KAK1569512.1 FHA domain-containing protein [Colletotrichum navitas]